MAVIYDQDFTAGNTDNWKATYSSTPDGNTVNNQLLSFRNEDGGAAASGGQVYWNDNNHNAFGIGKIALLAYNYASNMGLAAHTAWADNIVTLRVRTDVNFIMPRYARMVWWMQRTDPSDATKYWNMAFTGETLDRALGFGEGGIRANARYMETDYQDIGLALNPIWSKWECYGARYDKPQYTCPKSPTAFLSGPMVNMGIHIISADTAPVVNTYGELRISRIKIETP